MNATESATVRQGVENFTISKRTKINPFRTMGMKEITHYTFEADKDIILRFVDITGRRSALIVQAGNRLDSDIEPSKFEPHRIYITPCRRRTTAKVRMGVVGT